MAAIEVLTTKIRELFASQILDMKVAYGELTLEITPDKLREICFTLRDNPDLKFQILLDIAGVDYLYFGMSEWITTRANSSGFERGVLTHEKLQVIPWNKPRFAAVYHLLSIKHNQRIRLRVFVEGEPLLIPSIMDIWPSANWYEREAFDLYGILFDGHPDLRRILTDYGFIGHPFRKDFPLSGNVEVRYDATLKRVVYEPVEITPRITTPKVIRDPSHERQGEI